ncbi:hypothetical protein [Nostoc sp. C117]|uniref:hypothetical protein n=1 Tax=Nostoc sp. C117 TaxID=3349875 RepID=UPI00370D94C1
MLSNTNTLVFVIYFLVILKPAKLASTNFMKIKFSLPTALTLIVASALLTPCIAAAKTPMTVKMTYYTPESNTSKTGRPLGSMYSSNPINIDTSLLNQLDANQRTFFLIHGWNSSPTSSDGNLQNTGNDLQALYPRANIIYVDWSTIADYYDYTEVASMVTWVADKLSSSINQQGIDTTKTTFVGHSLGAHISGFTSAQLQTQYTKKVKEVVGLDPAAPFSQNFDATGTGQHNSLSSGLSKGQAQRVVAIHSSNSACSGQGNYNLIGDMDIYLRGGSGDQVYGGNCFMPEDHGLAIWTYQYMAERQLTKSTSISSRTLQNDDYRYAKGFAFDFWTGATYPTGSYTDTMQFFNLDDSNFTGTYTLDVSAQFHKKSYPIGGFYFPNKSGWYYSNGQNHYCQSANNPDQEPGSFNGNVLGGYYSMTYDGLCGPNYKDLSNAGLNQAGVYKFNNNGLVFYYNNAKHYCMYDSWKNFSDLNGGNTSFKTVYGDISEFAITNDTVCGG